MLNALRYKRVTWGISLSASFLLAYSLQSISINNDLNKISSSLSLAINNRHIDSQKNYSQLIDKYMNDFDIYHLELIDENNKSLFARLNSETNREADIVSLVSKEHEFSVNWVFNVQDKDDENSVHISKLKIQLNLNGLYFQYYGIVILCLALLFLFRNRGRLIVIDMEKKLEAFIKSVVSFPLDTLSLSENDNKGINALVNELISNFAERERELNNQVLELELKIDETLTAHDYFREKFDERSAYDHFFRKELCNAVATLRAGIIEIQQRVTDEKIRAVTETLERSVAHCDDILDLFKSAAFDQASSIKSYEDRTLFDQMQASIHRLHGLAESIGVQINYIPNSNICGEIHGFDKATAINIYFILKTMVQASKKGYVIQINTLVIDNDSGESYLQFNFSLANASSNTFSLLRKDQMQLVEWIVNRFGGSISAEQLVNPSNDTVTIEIVHRTPCQINMSAKPRMISSSKQCHIGVYDKNVAISTQMQNSIALAGYEAVKINSLANISDFDIIFVNEINGKNKDHVHLMSISKAVCSFERSIDSTFLDLQRIRYRLSASLSYCCSQQQIEIAIKNASKKLNSKTNGSPFESLPNHIAQPEWMNEILNKNKRKGELRHGGSAGSKVALMDQDLNRRNMILSLFNDKSDGIEIVDVSINSFSELELLRNMNPDFIILDENYQIEGQPVTMQNFVDAIKYTGIIAILAFENTVSPNILEISKHVIPSYARNLKSRIVNFCMLSKQSAQAKSSRQSNVYLIKR